MGAGLEGESGPASALHLEGQCGKGKRGLGDLLPSFSFLALPCLMPHISYESGNSFMLDRKKGEKGKRQKNQGCKATYSLRGLHLDP